MDYGVVLPHFGSFAKEEAARRIVAAAEAAESLGYSTVWVIDPMGPVQLPPQLEMAPAKGPPEGEPFMPKSPGLWISACPVVAQPLSPESNVPLMIWAVAIDVSARVTAVANRNSRMLTSSHNGMTSAVCLACLEPRSFPLPYHAPSV